MTTGRVENERHFLVRALEHIARMPCEDTAACLEKVGAIESIISFDHTLDSLYLTNMRLALRERAEELRPESGRSNKAGRRRC